MMRLFQAPSTLLYTIALILTSSRPSAATPYPRELDVDAAELQNNTLVARCDNPCGWAGQLCCPAGQTCYTDANNQAQCGAGGAATVQAQGGGYWQYYTTTYVETGYVTKTAVYSSYISPAVSVQQTYVPPQTTAVAGGLTCNYALNESPCNTVCCRSGQYCYNYATSQCAAAGGGSSEIYAGGFTTPFSAPLRPTTGTLVVVTATVSPTTTVPFETPVATGANVTLTTSQASGGGLSGGAIAGIVIGVILAIILLVLLCLYFCLRAGWDVLVGLFGGGKKKQQQRRRRTETEYVEEYHHHGAGGAAAAGGRRWYGDRPSRPERPPPPKKKGGGLGGAAGVAAALAALWAVLGIKRRRDRRQEAKTEYTGSTISSSYYDYTSSSSASSDDRRTRHSSRR